MEASDNPSTPDPIAALWDAVKRVRIAAGDPSPEKIQELSIQLEVGKLSDSTTSKWFETGTMVPEWTKFHALIVCLDAERAENWKNLHAAAETERNRRRQRAREAAISSGVGEGTSPPDTDVKAALSTADPAADSPTGQQAADLAPANDADDGLPGSDLTGEQQAGPGDTKSALDGADSNPAPPAHVPPASISSPMPWWRRKPGKTARIVATAGASAVVIGAGALILIATQSRGDSSAVSPPTTSPAPSSPSRQGIIVNTWSAKDRTYLGANAYKGPNTTERELPGFPEATSIEVVCHEAHGREGKDPTHRRTSTGWYKSADGRWVSDLYVQLNTSSGNHSAVPACSR